MDRLVSWRLRCTRLVYPASRCSRSGLLRTPDLLSVLVVALQRREDARAGTGSRRLWTPRALWMIEGVVPMLEADEEDRPEVLDAINRARCAQAIASVASLSSCRGRPSGAERATASCPRPSSRRLAKLEAGGEGADPAPLCAVYAQLAWIRADRASTARWITTHEAGTSTPRRAESSYATFRSARRSRSARRRESAWPARSLRPSNVSPAHHRRRRWRGRPRRARVSQLRGLDTEIPENEHTLAILLERGEYRRRVVRTPLAAPPPRAAKQRRPGSPGSPRA